MAVSALGALPGLTNPSPLVVHVTVADCGDPTDQQFTVVAELTQDATLETIRSWGSPATLPVTSWIDEAVSVPAQGGYTLTIRAGLAEIPSEYKVAVLGGVAVTVSHPELRFRAGSMTATSWPVVLVWSNTSVNAASGYRVRVNRDGAWGSWKDVTGTSYRLRVNRGHTYQFQVRGLNLAKASGPASASIVYRPRKFSEASSRINYAGTWRTSLNTRYLGNRTRFAKAAGARATFTFTGSAAAIVAPMGPTRGSFRVYADGLYQRTVKTYSRSAAYKIVVYGIAWPQSGPHTVQLRVKGTAGHPRVDLDGILTLE
jgi:hypothetical protein